MDEIKQLKIVRSRDNIEIRFTDSFSIPLYFINNILFEGKFFFGKNSKDSTWRIHVDVPEQENDEFDINLNYYNNLWEIANSNIQLKKSLEVESEKTGKDVFIVHGHDNEMLIEVENLIRKVELNPVILSQKLDGGRTIFKKFEEESANAGFAIALFSPDDELISKEKQARPNVLLELGYFWGRLNMNNVRILKKGKVNIPSDLHGFLYINFDKENEWKIKLVREMKYAGLPLNIEHII